MSYTKSWKENSLFEYTYKRNATIESSPRLVVFDCNRSGTKLDDWRGKIARGENASTPYTLDATRIVGKVSGSGSLTASIPGNPGAGVQVQNFAGFIRQPSAPLAHIPPTLGKAEAIALTKTYNKIRSEYQRLNSTATIAEFLDVVRQFGAPLNSIVDLTNRRLNRLELARKGIVGSNSFKRIKWHEIVASTYLEYAFGLAPLISDTRAIAEAFAQWQYEKTGQQRFRSRIISRGDEEVVKDSFSPNVIGSGSSNWFVFGVTDKTVTQHRVQYTCGLKLGVQAAFGSNERLLQLLGFTPENWIPGLYEAIPWSWLVDYFTNVNDILNAGVTSTSSVAWISKAVTQFTDRKVSARIDALLTQQRIISAGWSGSSTGHPDSYNVQRTTLTRTQPLSLGIPPLVLEHPFKDARKMANLTAVLLSRRASSSALWLF